MKLDPRMRTANVRNAEPVRPTRQGLLDAAVLGGSALPVVGDAVGLLADAHMFATRPESRTWTNGLLAAGAAIPGIPRLPRIRRGSIDAEDISHEITLPPSVGMTEMHKLTSPDLPGARLLLARQRDNFEPLLEVDAPTVPKGTGIGTAMYVRGLDMAKSRGIGWTSDMASPQAEAIYARLRKAGVPFRQVEGRYEISADELADVDLDVVEDALARNVSGE